MTDVLIKKGRKSKTPTPIYRSNSENRVSPDMSSSSPVTTATSSPPVFPGLVLKKPEALTGMTPHGLTPGAAPINAPPVSAFGGTNAAPIKSYSDFMRSLAAKYNNNDGSHNDPLSSSERALKAASALNPFLSLPPAAALQAFGLAGMANKDTTPMAAPNSFAGAFPMLDQLSSTQALLNLAARSSLVRPPNPSPLTPSPPLPKLKRPSESPLDLSGSPSPSPPSGGKRPRVRSQEESELSAEGAAMLKWSVQEVADYVETIELCKEYAKVFKEHNIDGSSLALLTDSHLTKRLGMKLGPAIKLRSSVQRALGTAFGDSCSHCAHCHARFINKNSDNNSRPGSRGSGGTPVQQAQNE